MSRPFQIATVSCLALLLMSGLMSVQPTHVAADTTQQPTMAATNQGTQAAAIVPQPGRWEGSNPSISFDVTVDGKIHNLSIVAPFNNPQVPGEACTYTVKQIDVKTVGTFSAKDLSDFSEFANSSALTAMAQIVGIPGPDSNGKYELRQILGQFTTTNTATGSVEVWNCGNSFIQSNLTSWKAAVVSLATPEPTSAATAVPTMAATQTAAVTDGKFELQITKVQKGSQIQTGVFPIAPSDPNKIAIGVWWATTDPELAPGKWAQDFTNDCTLKNVSGMLINGSCGGFGSDGNFCVFFLLPQDTTGLMFYFRGYTGIALN